MGHKELIEKIKELRKVMDEFIEGGSGYNFVLKFMEIHRFMQEMITSGFKLPIPPRKDEYII